MVAIYQKCTQTSYPFYLRNFKSVIIFDLLSIKFSVFSNIFQYLSCNTLQELVFAGVKFRDFFQLFGRFCENYLPQKLLENCEFTKFAKFSLLNNFFSLNTKKYGDSWNLLLEAGVFTKINFCKNWKNHWKFLREN